jgi:hypothetical protein
MKFTSCNFNVASARSVWKYSPNKKREIGWQIANKQTKKFSALKNRLKKTKERKNFGTKQGRE